jgi:hypothetical protein
VDGRRSCDQWSDHGNASTLRPWIIIKHPADSIDQLCQAFPAVRCSVRITQPALQCGRVLERNVGQRSAGPATEVAFAQLGYRFGLAAKT